MKLKYLKKFEGYNSIPEENYYGEESECESITTDDIENMSEIEIYEALRHSLSELNINSVLEVLNVDKLRQYKIEKLGETIRIYNATDATNSDRFVEIMIDPVEKTMTSKLDKKEENISRFKGFLNRVKDVVSVDEHKNIVSWCDVVIELDQLEMSLRN